MPGGKYCREDKKTQHGQCFVVKVRKRRVVITLWWSWKNAGWSVICHEGEKIQGGHYFAVKVRKCRVVSTLLWRWENAGWSVLCCEGEKMQGAQYFVVKVKKMQGGKSFVVKLRKWRVISFLWWSWENSRWSVLCRIFIHEILGLLDFYFGLQKIFKENNENKVTFFSFCDNPVWRYN